MGRLGRLAARIAGDCRGNMVLIAAGMLVALVAVGFGLDYGRAMALQARLAEAGHAAAMGAVSRPMQAQDDATAQGLATSLFTAQVSGSQGLVFDPAADVQVVLSDGGAGDGGRTAVVRWSARYATLFGGLFGTASLPIVGSATAVAGGAANVNFVLALAPASPSLQQAAAALDPAARQLAARNGVAYGVQIAATGAMASHSYGAVLSAVNATMAAPGDGATPAAAQGAVVLMTDGSPGLPGADDLAACTAIKQRGIVLAVLYAPLATGPVTGPATPGDAVQMAQTCASPQLGGAPLFVQAAPGQSVGEALVALFAMVAANARLVH